MTIFRLPACLALMSIVVLTLSACGEKNEPEQPAAYYTSLFCNTLQGERIPSVEEMRVEYPTTNFSFASETIKGMYGIRKMYIEDSGGLSTRNCSYSTEIVFQKGDKAEVMWSLSSEVLIYGNPFRTLSFKGKDSLELIDGTWTVVHSVNL